MVEYKTVAGEAETTLVEKKSKFIARIRPLSTPAEAEAFIEEVRKEHWSATHNVPAYILGMNQEVQKYSDDNEPSGTAGLPILEVLKAHQVVNVCVVVTRYFGGTLLGRGGLIRAYGGAARQALQEAGIVRMVPAQNVAITVDYVHSGKIQNELLTQGVTLVDTEYFEQVTFYTMLFAHEKASLRQMIQELTANDFAWIEGEEIHRPQAVDHS
ncbi:MAG TPA: YigZ family protein [Firmicutes bacterium]|nr:YigZ family protein [Bacillota bacterium]